MSDKEAPENGSTRDEKVRFLQKPKVQVVEAKVKFSTDNNPNDTNTGNNQFEDRKTTRRHRFRAFGFSKRQKRKQSAWEPLPRLSFYRDKRSAGKKAERPTLDDLHSARPDDLAVDFGPADGDATYRKARPVAVKFGWIQGVFVR